MINARPDEILIPDMAHTRQSRPDSGLDFQVKVLKTFLSCPLFARKRRKTLRPGWRTSSFLSLLLSSLELRDTKVYEPSIRALLGSALHFCEVVVLELTPLPRSRLPPCRFRVWGFWGLWFLWRLGDGGLGFRVMGVYDSGTCTPPTFFSLQVDRNPQLPSTNPSTLALNPQPSTLNSKPSTRNPKP